MPDQTVNIPLLRKAVEWAEVEAAKPVELCQWYQGEYAISPEQLARDPECGTCYCIAGYVAHQVTGETMNGAAHDAAAVALGLDYWQADDLFKGSNTIEQVRSIAEDIAGERL